MEQFPSNSRFPQKQEKPEAPKVQRVTTGGVNRHKPSLGRRMSHAFTGDDTKGVVEYVVADVLIPAAKAMMYDAVVEGAGRKIFGDALGRRGGGGFRPPGAPSGNGWTNYRPGLQTPPPQQGGMSKQGRAQHRFDEIIFDARVDAQQVVQGLFALLQEYEVVQVRSFYDLCGETWDYPDTNYGWYDLTGTDIRRGRRGYYILLPRPEPLN